MLTPPPPPLFIQFYCLLSALSLPWGFMPLAFAHTLLSLWSVLSPSWPSKLLFILQDPVQLTSILFEPAIQLSVESVLGCIFPSSVPCRSTIVEPTTC